MKYCFPYKPSCRLAIYGLAVALLIGCGGSQAGNSVEGRAKLTFKVNWPMQSRVIPVGTNVIKVNVMDAANKTAGTTTIAKGISQATISDLPSGAVTVNAYALDAGGVPLASGQSKVALKPSSDNAVSVELKAVPPPVDDDRYILGGTVAIDPDDPSKVRINLNAIINATDGTPVLGLTSINFRVLEDGIERSPVTVSPASSVKGAKVDVCFVLDSTGSMENEIYGVEQSVDSLVDSLTAAGQDVHLSGVEFGDEVRSTFAFTSSSESFKGWVNSLVANGGDDDPENPLDATLAGLSFNWRTDAQHVFVIVTDAPAHEAGDGTGVTDQTIESVASRLKGGYVVDTVSPGGVTGPKKMTTNLVKHNDGTFTPANASKANDQRDISLLASLTGGKSLLLPSDGSVDLSKLGIADLILAGYIIEFRSPLHAPPVDHQVRLVTIDAGKPVADQIFPGRY